MAGNATIYEYNGINQLATMTDPEGKQETYVYDAEECLCRKTDRNGAETRYTYNLYGNLLERRAKSPTDATELSERYEYTAEGLLKSAIAQGMRYDYTYDIVDRLSAKMASGRLLLGLAYDRNGNLIQQKDVTGKVMEYRYDLSDRISEVWDVGKQIAEYGYNADSTVKSLHCGSLYTEYAYDADRADPRLTVDMDYKGRGKGPSGVHNGYGGIHNVEKQNGVRGNDRLTSRGQAFKPSGTTKKKK